MPLAQLVTDDKKLGDKAAELLKPCVGVARRTTKGGSGPVPGAIQAIELSAALTVMHARVATFNAPQTNS